MLEIRDLHAFYGESHILHGVSLDVRKGEVVTLLGRNGAGNTTTMRSIMGIVGKRTGSIQLNGPELVGLPSNKIAKLGIGYVPEERGIFSSLNVEENLMLPPTMKPGGMDVEAIYTLFPNLKERRKSQGTRLSGGEQQMLAIGAHPAHRRATSSCWTNRPRAGAGDHPADRPGRAGAEAARPDDPAGRAELPLRRHHRRPALRDGGRPHRRHDPERPSSKPIWKSCTGIWASDSTSRPRNHKTKPLINDE